MYQDFSFLADIYLCYAREGKLDPWMDHAG